MTLDAKVRTWNLASLQRGRDPKTAECGSNPTADLPGAVLQRGRDPKTAECPLESGTGKPFPVLQRGRDPKTAEWRQPLLRHLPGPRGFNGAAIRRPPNAGI